MDRERLHPDDICAGTIKPRTKVGPAPSQPIHLASVYECNSPEEADAILAGQQPGYVYARDGHPNGETLAGTLARLHRAQRAIVTATGMAALGTAALSQLRSGDHLIASDRLYGRTRSLFCQEAARLGIETTVLDTNDLSAVQSSLTPQTRMLVVETLSNPLLRVANIEALASIAHSAKTLLLVDNTFASPIVCRPLELGADLVVESLTKMINGHSDVVLGLLCGHEKHWERVEQVVSSWGLAASPFDCWLTQRGLHTLHLRLGRAQQNAQQVANFLCKSSKVTSVIYPGLANHPDKLLAKSQFSEQYGSMVTFTLVGGLEAARQFIAETSIPFCPSLGELCTTLSHPSSTSNRGLTSSEQRAIGIDGGMIRLSVGTETVEFIINGLQSGLSPLDDSTC